MNTDRYEADWKFDTDRRLAKLENADAGVRIAALEDRSQRIDRFRTQHDQEVDKPIAALAQRIDDWISADVTSSSGWEERITALEKRFQEIEILLLSASTSRTELHKRIAALEENHDLRDEFVRVYKRIAALEEGRIDVLENELKDFSAWAIEVFGPIGPPGGGKNIEARIAALEDKIGPEFVKFISERMADLLQSKVDTLVQEARILKDFAEKRIVELEAQFSEFNELPSMQHEINKSTVTHFDILEKRIDMLERARSIDNATIGRLLKLASELAVAEERIAALEDKIK